MIAGFMSKPLKGNLFEKFRKIIMVHMNVLPQYLEQQECVVRKKMNDGQHTDAKHNQNYLYACMLDLTNH